MSISYLFIIAAIVVVCLVFMLVLRGKIVKRIEGRCGMSFRTGGIMLNGMTVFPGLLSIVAILSAPAAKAQLNIVATGDGIVEYSSDNAIPNDSLAPFLQSYENYPKLPGQTLFFQGMKNDMNGYPGAFFTSNPLKGNATVYHSMGGGAGNTAPDAVVGKYFEVIKVFCQHNSRYCLLLREQKSGDEVYCVPGIMTANNFVCIGNYEKMKQLHVGKTFYSLGKRIGLVGGGSKQTEERKAYLAVDIAVELHDNGAYLILEDSNGQRLKGMPYGHIVAGFVAKERVDSLVARYGKETGERIAFQHVTEGMTKAMLVEAFGEPIKKEKTTFNGKSAEIWRYPEGYYIGVQNDKVVSVRKSSYYW